jgi:hypothetical protein
MAKSGRSKPADRYAECNTAINPAAVKFRNRQIPCDSPRTIYTEALLVENVMKRRLVFAFVTLSLFTTSLSTAGGPDQLDEPLKPFAPLVGKTWKGEFKSSTPEKPLFDTSRWERALNGKAVRVLHSVNDGVYGGETIITWDAKKVSLVYWYFTTAGFRTEGTMKHENGQWSAREVVVGAASGITEVKSTSKLLPDGRLHVTTEYLKDGTWGAGREVFYKETPDAKVVFK